MGIIFGISINLFVMAMGIAICGNRKNKTLKDDIIEYWNETTWMNFVFWVFGVVAVALMAQLG